MAFHFRCSFVLAKDNNAGCGNRLFGANVIVYPFQAGIVISRVLRKTTDLGPPIFVFWSLQSIWDLGVYHFDREELSFLKYGMGVWRHQEPKGSIS